MESIESTIDCEANRKFRGNERTNEMELEEKGKAECFFINLKEPGLEKSEGESCGEVFEGGTQLDLLLWICEADEKVEGCEEVSNLSDDVDFCNEGEEKDDEIGDGLVCYPLCGNDITEFTDELRQVHTNECLDKEGTTNEDLYGMGVLAFLFKRSRWFLSLLVVSLKNCIVDANCVMISKSSFGVM